jgi:hypothetical protein
MSKQYPGGLITKNPVVPSGPYETSTASGIWTLEDQAYWQKLGQWPTAGNLLPTTVDYLVVAGAEAQVVVLATTAAVAEAAGLGLALLFLLVVLLQ